MLVKVRDVRVDATLADLVLQFYKLDTRMQSLYNLHVALFETILNKNSGNQEWDETDREYMTNPNGCPQSQLSTRKSDII